MVLWEAVLSPALQILFDKLASGDILQFLRSCNLKDLLLEKLKIAYLTNAAVLDDAEKKQYDNPAIETWLDMLKNAVYEAEDTLDELATEALRCKVESGSAQTFSNQVSRRNLFAANFSLFGERINSRIENLIVKLEYIAKQKDALGLKSGEMERKRTTSTCSTTPLLNDSHVYGRTSEKEDIMKLLVDDHETNRNMPSIIPILGMGGMGKTTLAQIIYNDQRVDEFFDVKAWAHVSDDFNLIHITKSLLESATAKPCGTMNLELLQRGLRDAFNKKKFLVVLDDVWNERLDNWNDLSIPFMVGSPGSKIIVTTRNEEVLSVMNASPHHHLKELPDEACWRLFRHQALGVGDSELHSSLIPIGKKIMKKCKGLPLAVKTLGSIMTLKLDKEYWNAILYSNLWEVHAKKNSVLPSLRLSYHHLPSNLKRCFAYCSIFPKGYEFDKKNLILLWMAEGFVQPMGKISLEEVGEEYFSELLARSFFQSVQDKTRYVMHDLLNDLAQSVSRKMCVHLEEIWEKGHHENFEKVRHFSCFRSKYDVYRKFESLNEAKGLRTFLPLASPQGDEFCYLTKKVSCNLLTNLTCLRVMSLRHYCISALPESIGNLKHLRYLDLSYTEICELPKSLCTLFNLQTLLLCNCDYLTELPDEIGKLVNLRYLDIGGSGIQEMPPGLGNLVNLRSLPQFIVGSSVSGNGNLRKLVHLQTLPQFIVGSSASGIGDLRKLVHLQGSLRVSGLENVSSLWDARRANLHEKKGLNSLALEWSTSSDELLDVNVVTEVLEMLQPNPKLEKVEIKNYPGKNFPSWIGDPLFCTLVTLTLSGCYRCELLPPAGQLRSLKNLRIEGMLGIKSVGVEFYGYSYSSLGSFASLQNLSFKNMPEWEDWSFDNDDRDTELFPVLVELYLQDCQKLQGQLPYHLSSLTKLVINNCDQLSSLLPVLPELREMELKECHLMSVSSTLHTNLLTSLEMQNMKNLTSLPEGLLQCSKNLEQLVISDCFELVYLARQKDGLLHLTSLRRLTIRSCPSMVSLSEELQQLPQNLEYLELDRCHSLERLPHEFQKLTSLQELVITDCPKLETSSETIFPSNLKGLVLRGCGMELLPENMITNISSLEYLYVSGCLVLTSFPRDKRVAPMTFKQFTIDQCPNLEFLPEGLMHSSNIFLELLEIFDCASITSFPEGTLPKTLKTLTLWNCSNLESLADVIGETTSLESLRIGNCTNLKHLPSRLHTFIYLDYLEIDGCPSMVSFPEQGLPSTMLKKMHVLNCDNLKFVTKRMKSLTSLQELRVSNCPMIMSFPEDGMPINLVSLDIKDCGNMKPFSEWGLHRLNSLQKLRISGVCLNNDTFSEWLLPSTIESLHLIKQPNLKSLSPWLKNLTSLEELKIKDCQKILSLPREGLPPMVSFLEINNCPLLRETCENDLSSIDHIPCIVM